MSYAHKKPIGLIGDISRSAFSLSFFFCLVWNRKRETEVACWQRHGLNSPLERLATPLPPSVLHDYTSYYALFWWSAKAKLPPGRSCSAVPPTFLSPLTGPDTAQTWKPHFTHAFILRGLDSVRNCWRGELLYGSSEGTCGERQAECFKTHDQGWLNIAASSALPLDVIHTLPFIQLCWFTACYIVCPLFARGPLSLFWHTVPQLSLALFFSTSPWAKSQHVLVTSFWIALEHDVQCTNTINTDWCTEISSWH